MLRGSGLQHRQQKTASLKSATRVSRKPYQPLESIHLVCKDSIRLVFTTLNSWSTRMIKHEFGSHSRYRHPVPFISMKETKQKRTRLKRSEVTTSLSIEHDEAIDSREPIKPHRIPAAQPHNYLSLTYSPPGPSPSPVEHFPQPSPNDAEKVFTFPAAIWELHVSAGTNGELGSLIASVLLLLVLGCTLRLIGPW